MIGDDRTHRRGSQIFHFSRNNGRIYSIRCSKIGRFVGGIVIKSSSDCLVSRLSIEKEEEWMRLCWRFEKWGEVMFCLLLHNLHQHIIWYIVANLVHNCTRKVTKFCSLYSQDISSLCSVLHILILITLLQACILLCLTGLTYLIFSTPNYSRTEVLLYLYSSTSECWVNKWIINKWLYKY